MNIKIKKVYYLFFFLISGGLLSACLRHENMWDLYNYHYYNGFALLNGRIGYDLAPASIMSFFNPLLDVITYLILSVFNENVALYSFSLGLFFGGLMYVLFLINSLFFDISTRQGKIAATLSLIVGATGFATWFQIGTSTNEISVSIFVLAGIYILLKQIRNDDKRLSSIFVAGFLIGSAAGLKYTAAIYCLTSGIAFILFCKKISPYPIKALFLFIIGGLSGFLTFSGYWLYLMYKNYESPFFPIFNEIFKSPYFPEINTRDELHVAGRSVWQFLMVPIELINHTKKKGLVGFCRFTDVRFYFMYIFGAICLCMRLFKNVPEIRPQTLFLIIFTGTSFLVWLFFFSIIRYTIPIETLLAILFTASMKSILPYFSRQKAFLKYMFAFLCIFVFAVLIVTPFSSEEGQKLSRFDSVLNLPKKLEINNNSLIYLLNDPASYLAVDLLKKNPKSRIIGFSTSEEISWKIAPMGIIGYGKFKEKTANIIKNHKGSIIMIGHAAYPIFNNGCRTLKAVSIISDEKPLFYFSCSGPKEEIEKIFPNLYMGIIDKEKSD